MLCGQVLSPGISYNPLPQVKSKHVKASSLVNAAQVLRAAVGWSAER